MGEKPAPHSAECQTGEEVKHDYCLFVSGTNQHSQKYIESVRSDADPLRPPPPRRIVGDFSPEAVLAAKLEFTGSSTV